MLKCKHACADCDETWECSFPYYSEFKYFKTTVENGYYCNAFCPSCQEEKRKEIDDLFGDMAETGYINSFHDQNLKAQNL
jgi:hypothetical protein